MKKILLTLVLGFSIISKVSAVEGMIIPAVVAAFESDMQAMGMKLTAEEIYSINNSSLKDAIIHFGGGCTAELVSNQGLLLTNHHCGYSQIQSHSSLENDYLKFGYWAKTKADELPNPGLTASRMVRIQDVTADVLAGTEGKTAQERAGLIGENIKTLIEDAKKGNHFLAEIKPFNEGNEFYMIVKEEFLDVRFVGTPPNSIGKFGGDTDNWVWPRHTGDFSVFRIYTGSDNKPAEYNVANKPYEPLHYLPISFKDRHVGDFTMVYGFPGQTEQHVISNYLKFIMEKERPARIAMREKSLSVIDAAMRSSDELRIKYAAKQARIANGYKKWIGQIDGLRRLDAIAIKHEREAEYNKRAASKNEWKQEFGPLVELMNALVDSDVNSEFEYSMAIEYLYVGPEYFQLVRGFDDLILNYTKYEEEGKLEEVKAKMIASAEGFFKNYDATVDQKIFELLTDEYYSQIEKAPKYDKFESGVGVLATSIYSKSMFTNLERYKAGVNGYTPKKMKKLSKKDIGYKHWKIMNDYFRGEVIADYRMYLAKMSEYMKTYVKGNLTMYPEVNHWADANSTLRITYGKLEGSQPTDGVQYIEHTTTDGIIAKFNSGNPDFELLPELVEAYKKKDFGDYAQDGELWVCFTGSNHTTGGNSGSPVIDANGHLMGLNFDRSWESTMSDFMFDASRCRNIVVDIRYVLWVMDKYAGAKHLVDEMTLVKE